jgi:hypothetical protein
MLQMLKLSFGFSTDITLVCSKDGQDFRALVRAGETQETLALNKTFNLYHVTLFYFHFART